jgi:PLP dependent protein
METMSLVDSLNRVKDRIRTAALKAHRDPETVRLVAVSKTVPPERVRLAVAAGVSILGENYVQEAREKFNALVDQNVSWHFIGHLQTNKAKYAVRLFDMIHSVDSLKLARELNRQAMKAGKIQPVLLQVDLAGEASKSGVDAAGAARLVREAAALEHLSVQGLMTLPPFFNAPERVRPFFASLRQLRDRIRREEMADSGLKELSMGMSGDFEVAIEEGATLVRVGTAIFGDRQ